MLKKSDSLKIRLRVKDKIITATLIDSKTKTRFHVPAAANADHERSATTFLSYQINLLKINENKC